MNIRLKVGTQSVGDTEEHGYFVEMSDSSPEAYYLHVWHRRDGAGAVGAGAAMLPLAQAADQPFYDVALHVNRVARESYRMRPAGTGAQPGESS